MTEGSEKRLTARISSPIITSTRTADKGHQKMGPTSNTRIKDKIIINKMVGKAGGVGTAIKAIAQTETRRKTTLNRMTTGMFIPTVTNTALMTQ